MKISCKKKPAIKRSVTLTIIIVLVINNYQFAQNTNGVDTIQHNTKNYLATSAFILTSFIPNDDTYFFELDYGRKLRKNMDVIFGLNVYKYTSPMSTPINDNTEYLGTVTSYGLVTAFQYYFWKNLFIDQMVNPLMLDYSHTQLSINKNGFMLLLATRLGYHHDFSLFNNLFFVELGAEVSYWPINMNVPDSFKSIDDLYKSFAFSPAFQVGFNF